jgi:hypothetical protein
VTEATDVTEDEDTLVINGQPVANDNQSVMSDVTLPLGATKPGRASEMSSKRRSKATPVSRTSSKSRKSTKSMGTIPEADVPSSSSEPIELFDEGDDEIIIGEGRASAAHGTQSETAADELTLNVQAEPSTATTVDQNHSIGVEEDEGDEGDEEDTNNAAEEGLNKENASEGNGRRGGRSDSTSPSKEPTRRSARNRRTASSAGAE